MLRNDISGFCKIFAGDRRASTTLSSFDAKYPETNIEIPLNVCEKFWASIFVSGLKYVPKIQPIAIANIKSASVIIALVALSETINPRNSITRISSVAIIVEAIHELSGVLLSVLGIALFLVVILVFPRGASR